MHDPHDRPETISAKESYLDLVVREYLEAAERGDAPGRAEFLKQHAEIAGDLEAFFEDLDHLDGLEDQLATSGDSATDHSAFAREEPPRRFGDYEILEELGRGGMGVVYKARQVSLDRIVALKMLLPGAIASAEDLRRFRLEAEAAATLEHPHIVAIHEIGTEESNPFFTMRSMRVLTVV